MKRKIVCVLMAAMMLFTTACSTPNLDEAVNLQEEIPQVLVNAEYENLEILFDEISYYNGQALEIVNIGWYNEDEHHSYKETLELYANEVFPDLMGVEELNKAYMWDGGSIVRDDDLTYYEISYEQMLEKIESYEQMPMLIYIDEATKKEIYYSNNWFSGVFISQGQLGQYGTRASAIAAARVIQDEKEYDTRYDDLSDSYLLIDGEKTVAEAKAEMEAYLNAHYPITGRDNGIKNEIYAISVGKVADTEYYAFSAGRTFSYNGIPFSEMPPEQNTGGYHTIMAVSCLCESNKVDVTYGLINGYTEPEVERVIERPASFEEVLDNVSSILTGETKFQLIYGGLEYRMLKLEGNASYQLTPYWCFMAKNTKDDKMYKIYVDMETGEAKSFRY